MNRRLSPTKSPYQVKDEQVIFLLEGFEKELRGIQKNSRNKGQTASRSGNILQGAKNSYEALTKENKQLKGYVIKIKQQYKQQQQQQQQHYFQQEREYFKAKKYKKVVYEEASEEDTITEEIVEQK